MFIAFLLGVLSTIGAEIAAVAGAAHRVSGDLESARASFASAFAAYGAQLDQFVAGLNLPF